MRCLRPVDVNVKLPFLVLTLASKVLVKVASAFYVAELIVDPYQGFPFKVSVTARSASSFVTLVLIP